jgi:predicted unusual protein kinase regulating ubiquinone biosynthesis (AarF/ABC1/UbiB family)
MIDKATKLEVSEIALEKIEGFRRELGDFFQFLFREDTEEVEIAKAFSHVLELGKKWKVKIDSSMATVIIGIILFNQGTIVIEGMGRQLSPELDFMSESKPALSQSKDMRNAYFKARFGQFMSKTESEVKDSFDSLKDRLSNLLE